MESPERRIMESFLEILVFEPLTGGHSLCVSPWHQHMKSTEANLNYCPHCVSVRGWITGEPVLVECDITVAQLCLDRQSLWQSADQPCLFIFTGVQAPWTWDPWYPTPGHSRKWTSKRSQYTCLDPAGPYSLSQHHPCQTRVWCGPVKEMGTHWIRRPSSSSQLLGRSNKVRNLLFLCLFSLPLIYPPPFINLLIHSYHQHLMSPYNVWVPGTESFCLPILL